MGEIFLSHVEEDQALMLQVARGLETAGYRTWYFERDVLPGTSYLIQITRAIESCDAIVLIASPEALGSDQVTREIVGGFERGKDFFPLLVNISPSELKQQQLEWRHALGGTAMIMANLEDFSSTINSIINGLDSIKILNKPASEQNLLPPRPHEVSPGKIEGERKNVTVMFAGISGFSALTDKMDTEEIAELMNQSYSILENCMYNHGGIITESMGGIAMAIFGAPRALEDAPHRALNAAIEIKMKIREFSDDKQIPISLKTHTGINTGTVITGKGSGSRKESCTVSGDTVSLTSHLHAYASNDEILVSESTCRMVGDFFIFKDLGFINIKGSEQPVQIYSLTGPGLARNRVAASLSKGLTPFKGRSMEIAQMTESYKKTVQGEGQVTGIIGEPGMGKSRLALEFIRTLPPGEFLYIEGSCQHSGETIPYLPVMEIIRDYMELKDGDSESISRDKITAKICSLQNLSEKILPPVYELLSLKIEDKSYSDMDSRERRDKIFDSIRLLLAAASRIKPVIIAVDDLHWIDNTSEEFLGFLINSITATRIMLILMYRPEYVHKWSKKTFYNQIRLNHLSGNICEDLIQAILNNGDVSRELKDLIITTTTGNPFFMEELIKSLLENNSIDKTGETYLLSTKHSNIKVPDTVHGIIADRIDRLDMSLKKIIQAASVIGRKFEFRVLESVEMSENDLRNSLATLQDLELIYEETVSHEIEYTFKHAMTREVAYNSILIKKRKETHELVAQSIEKIYAERIEKFYEILANHYSISGNSIKACRYYRLSAEKAANKYANNEALILYKEALKLLDKMADMNGIKDEKLSVLVSVARPLFLLGYPDGTYDLLKQAENLANELNDDKTLARVHLSMSYYHTFKGDLSTGISFAEKCFNEAEKISATDLMLQSANPLCFAYSGRGDALKSADISRRALKQFEEHNLDRNLILNGFNVYLGLATVLGGSLAILGQIEEAKKYLDEVVLNSGDTNNMAHRISALFYLAQISYFVGDGRNMVDHSLEMAGCCEKTEFRSFHGLALAAMGVGYLLLDEYKKAREYGEKGLADLKESGININTAWCDWFLSTILVEDPDTLPLAEECAQEALNYAREIGAKHLEAAATVLHSFSIGKREPLRIDKALQAIRLGISMFEDMKLLPSTAMGYLFLGELQAEVSQEEGALENLTKAESLFQELKQHDGSYWISRIHRVLESLHKNF